MPVASLPELAIALVLIIIYFMVEFIVICMNTFSAYTGVSHFMVGLTLMVWGSDNMEMLNYAVALSKGQEEIGLTAVFVCQVLCMTLVVPVACISRMVSHNSKEIQLLQEGHSRNALLVPVILVTSVVWVCFMQCNMHINRKVICLFTVMYISYIVYCSY